MRLIHNGNAPGDHIFEFDRQHNFHLFDESLTKGALFRELHWNKAPLSLLSSAKRIWQTFRTMMDWPVAIEAVNPFRVNYGCSDA